MSDPRTVLTTAQVTAELTGLPGWSETGDQLRVGYRCGSAGAALALIADIGALAEELDHHPDVDWRYDRVLVATTSHDVGHRLTRRDTELAGRISNLPSVGRPE